MVVLNSDFHDQDPLLIPLHFLFHNYCRNPCPHHLWFCDTDHANCSTGSVAHGFNSYRSEKTQWLKRILHPAAQNKHRGEATAKKPRRQEPCGQKRHTANSTVLTPAGQKHHSGWKEFCPPLVRKDTVANPLRRYHDSKAPGDIVYRIGLGSRNAVAVRKKHIGGHAARLHCSKMNRSHGPDVDMFSINMPRHAHRQSAQPIC